MMRIKQGQFDVTAYECFGDKMIDTVDDPLSDKKYSQCDSYFYCSV